MLGNCRMKIPASMYKRHRFPAVIIQYAVWLYFRFNLRRVNIHAAIYNLFNLGRAVAGVIWLQLKTTDSFERARSRGGNVQ